MSRIRFAWDARKDATNKSRHGVSFREASTAFVDEFALVMADPEHSDEEDRFVLLGLSSKLRILVVVHCYREDAAVIRIISARKANKHERGEYTSRIPT